MDVINVGYVSDISPDDRYTSSGTNFQMYKSLSKQEGINLIWIPFRGNFFTKWLNIVYKVLNRTVMPHVFPEDRSPFIFRYIANRIDRGLLKQCDVLFCPFTQLYTEKPVVYLSDALYNEMVGYYIATPRESRQFRISDKLQRSVVENASHMIFSSRWAADDAAIHYEQPTNKISIVKFGPNIDDSDITPPLTVCII